jgi:hypothetical protein
VQAALSTMALVVVLVRSAQIARVSNDTGAIALWRPILTTQAAYWISWSLWAGALVPVIRRLVERRPSRPAGVGVLIALALAPSMLLPMVYAPVHWWAFGEQWPLHSAYHHMVTHDVLTNFLLGGTIVGVVYGFLSLQRTRRLEVQAAQLGEQLTRAQLETLRAQLDPHFLFNSLNSVAVLARRGKVAEVEQMVTGICCVTRSSHRGRSSFRFVWKSTRSDGTWRSSRCDSASGSRSRSTFPMRCSTAPCRRSCCSHSSRTGSDMGSPIRIARCASACWPAFRAQRSCSRCRTTAPA